MFGFDFPEIVIIFGVALVVLGPKKLPGAAAQIGRWVGRARSMARQFREQLEQEVNSVESALDTNAKLQKTIKPPASSTAVTPEPAPSAGPAEALPAEAFPVKAFPPESFPAEALAEDPSLFAATGVGWPGYLESPDGSLAPYGDPDAIPAPESESSEEQLSLQLDLPSAAPAARTAAPSAPPAPAATRPAAADEQAASHARTGATTARPDEGR